MPFDSTAAVICFIRTDHFPAHTLQLQMHELWQLTNQLQRRVNAPPTITPLHFMHQPSSTSGDPGVDATRSVQMPSMADALFSGLRVPTNTAAAAPLETVNRPEGLENDLAGWLA
jgi:hypothetical protein